MTLFHSRTLTTLAGTLSLALLLAGARAGEAAEISAFVSLGVPAADWGEGYGGAFTITLFNLIHGEIEGAYQTGSPGTGLLSGAAKVYVGPTIKRVIPFVGIGVGVYSESASPKDDTGTFGSAFVGAKLKLPLGVVIRFEYDFLALPEDAPVRMQGRALLGVGLTI